MTTKRSKSRRPNHQHNLVSNNLDSYYQNSNTKSAFVNDSNIILRMESMLKNNSSD